MSDGAPPIDIEIYGKTDVGLIREHNEDNFLVADVTAGVRTNDGKEPLKLKLGDKGALLLVCDGMGGAAAGEVASQMAVDSIFEALAAAEPSPRDAFARLVRRSVELANERIFIQSRDNQSERGMGTTCTVAALIDSTLVVGQIGDSRCYILRDGKLAQVTKDQSLAWQLIEAGAMTPEEAKAFEHANIILQALGVQERVEVVLSQVDLRRGDVALLCSDGLHGPVGDDELLSVLVMEPDLKKAADALIQKALDRDGPDNITVVLARFEGEGLKAPAPEDVVTFVAYDPGSDPVAEPPQESGATTIDMPAGLPKELLNSEEVVTKADPGQPVSGRSSSRPVRGARSLLAFFFIALVAAAAGGIFVMKCERDQAARADAPASAP
ncbi:MAG TPA: PP2C family serine/threonine-protein phosphatase [Polyangia bacterium]|nr:PP2C family serine/threonine-protein phosphatase [Polyangia bacterium]